MNSVVDENLMDLRRLKEKARSCGAAHNVVTLSKIHVKLYRELIVRTLQRSMKKKKQTENRS